MGGGRLWPWVVAGAALAVACDRIDDGPDERGARAHREGAAAASASGGEAVLEPGPIQLGHDLVVTPLWHASVQVRWRGRNIYVDLAYRGREGVALPRADLLLVTRAHADHLDAEAIRAVARPGTILLGPESVLAAASRQLLPRVAPDRRSAVVGVETAVPEAHVMVETYPAYPRPDGRAPGASPHGEAASLVVTFDERRVLFAGDAGCTDELRALRRIDLAFLPMGSAGSTSPVRAGECAAALDARRVVPYQQGGDDPLSFARALRRRAPEREVLLFRLP